MKNPGILCSGVIFLLAAGCSSQEQPSPSRPDTARIQQIIQSYVQAGKFMGSVLVERDGKVLLDQGYGFANLEWNIPNSDIVKFRLGSLTKQFTAASILLLEERGKLSVTEPVKKYMPDAPAAWDKITIFNLLTHTSGIPNFTSFPEYPTSEPFATTPEALVARFRNKPLDFEPGTKWNYSNSGYVLLGYLLEKISGENYAEFVQKNIFTPLGMKDSGYDSNAVIIEHRASGYTPTPKGTANAGYINMTIPFSAGALYSTTTDLMKWEEGLFGGKVLSAEGLKKMTTPFKQDYAFGLSVHDEQGHRVIEHGGGIEGFNTQVSYYPEDKLAVIVLANLNGPVSGQLAQQLAAVVHGQKVVLSAERKEISLAPALLTAYVGTYQLMPTFSIAITQEGSQLFEQATNQPRLPIYPESETLFFLKAVDAQIEFVRNHKGDVTGMILHQGGQDMKGEKK